MEIQSTLYYASRTGLAYSVQELIHGEEADVNAQGGQYGNALQAASDGGHDKIIQLLIENGADVEAKDNSGLTSV
ncbi:hypothetical protein BJ170DRAFT_588950 [Xylariales sp. AK1849]|nr:hypothetical protein BJ170DRAFT_588950 [Xylariales sp. AK1849]